MSRRKPRRRAMNPAPVFAALGDDTRLALYGKLGDGRARSIIKLAEGSPLSRQAITRHLHVLQQAGLVSSSRTGRESLFTLEPGPVAEARSYLDTVLQQWDDALSRLRSFVEK